MYNEKLILLQHTQFISILKSILITICDVHGSCPCPAQLLETSIQIQNSKYYIVLF